MIRFAEYDGYGRKPKNAARAIRKKYPDLSLPDCEEAFLTVLATYEEAIALVESRQEEFWRVFKATGGKSLVPADVLLTQAQRHPSLPEPVLSGMLAWIFYWHHLR